MVDNSKIDDLTEIDCAYIAGLIDGEGSIYVMKHREKTFYPAISIAMTHQDVLAWFAKKLGLSVSDVPRTPVGWRNQYSCRIHGKRAVALCRRLLPHLKVKREQAEMLLDFPFEARAGRSPRGRFLDPEIVAKRAELREQVNALNARGTQ